MMEEAEGFGFIAEILVSTACANVSRGRQVRGDLDVGCRLSKAEAARDVATWKAGQQGSESRPMTSTNSRFHVLPRLVGGSVPGCLPVSAPSWSLDPYREWAQTPFPCQFRLSALFESV